MTTDVEHVTNRAPANGCHPDRPLPAVSPSLHTTCEVCSTPMFRRWNQAGIDFTWYDKDGSRAGGRSPIPGVNTVGGFLNYLLQSEQITEYSGFSAKAALGSGLLPWQHWHKPQQPAPPELPEGVPECCGMPMQLIRDGWRCRQRRTVFPREVPARGSAA